MSDGPLKAALAGFALARTLFGASRPAPRTLRPRPAARRTVAPELPPPPTRRLFGVSVADLSRAEVVARIIAWTGRPPARVVLAATVDHVLALRDDPAVRAASDRADLVTADAAPFVWLAKREGRPLRERIDGADLVVPAAQAAARAGRSVFLFGATADRLVAAAVALKRAAPRLVVAGTLAPPAGSERDVALVPEHVAVLRAARPDIVMVALDTPAAALWSARMGDALGTGVFLTVGAGFDAVAGGRRAARTARSDRRTLLHAARTAAALPSLYGFHKGDLAEREAARRRAQIAAESEAALRRNAPAGG